MAEVDAAEARGLLAFVVRACRADPRIESAAIEVAHAIVVARQLNNSVHRWEALSRLFDAVMTLRVIVAFVHDTPIYGVEPSDRPQATGDALPPAPRTVRADGLAADLARALDIMGLAPPVHAASLVAARAAVDALVAPHDALVVEQLHGALGALRAAARALERPQSGHRRRAHRLGALRAAAPPPGTPRFTRPAG